MNGTHSLEALIASINALAPEDVDRVRMVAALVEEMRKLLYTQQRAIDGGMKDISHLMQNNRMVVLFCLHAALAVVRREIKHMPHITEAEEACAALASEYADFHASSQG